MQRAPRGAGARTGRAAGRRPSGSRSPRSIRSRSCSTVTLIGSLLRIARRRGDPAYYRCSGSVDYRRAGPPRPDRGRGARGARGRGRARAHPSRGRSPRRPARGLDQQLLRHPRGPADRGAPCGWSSSSGPRSRRWRRSFPTAPTSPTAPRSWSPSSSASWLTPERAGLALARYELFLEARRRPEFQLALDRVRREYLLLVEQLLPTAGCRDPHATRRSCWRCSTAWSSTSCCSRRPSSDDDGLVDQLERFFATC